MQFITLMLVPVIVGPLLVHKFYKGNHKKKTVKTLLKSNLLVFSLSLGYLLLFMTSQVYAASTTGVSITSDERAMAFLSAAIVTGLCTLGTGLATGMAAQSALAALSENESLMGKSLIFVALAEGIAIYGLLIAFTILARV